MQGVSVRLCGAHGEVDHRMWRHAEIEQLRGTKHQNVCGWSRFPWQRFRQKFSENGLDFALVAKCGEEEAQEKRTVTRFKRRCARACLHRVFNRLLAVKATSEKLHREAANFKALHILNGRTHPHGPGACEGSRSHGPLLPGLRLPISCAMR